MRFTTFLIILSFFLTLNALSLGILKHEDQKTLDPAYPVIRNATIDDLDDITDVIIAAFSAGPVYDYVYQFRKQHPKFHIRCRRQQIKEGFFGNPANPVIHVIDVPDEGRPGKKTRVASVAVWELLKKGDEHVSFDVFSTMSATDCFEHIDLNFTRALSYSYQFGAAMKRYIDDAYDHQFYLSTLATHPDYDGNGFGAAQCHWGMEYAKQISENVTLISTPAGYPLYVSLGFESLVNISITKVGGGPLFWFEDMIWRS